MVHNGTSLNVCHFLLANFEMSLGHKQGRLTGKRESTPARSDGGGESAILADLQELNGKGGSGVKPHKTNLPASTDKSKKRKQMNSEAKSKDEKSMVTKGHSTRRKRAAVREYPELSYPRLTECGLLGDIVRKTARLELTALVKRLEQDQEIRPCLVAIVEAVKKFEAKSQKLDKLGVMIHDVKAQMQGRREKMAFLKDVVKKLEAEDLAWDEAEESIASGDLSEYNGPTSLPPNSVGNEAKEQQREVAADGSGVAQHLNELIDLMSGCESTARCFTAKLSKHASLIDQAQEVQSQLYDVYKRLKFKGYPNIDDPKSAIKAITKK